MGTVFLCVCCFALGGFAGILLTTLNVYRRRDDEDERRFLEEQRLNLIPVRDLVDDGWQQEINRQYLHPRGLSLVISTNVEDEEDRIVGIADHRNNRTGVVFPFEPEWDKALNVERERHDIDERKRHFGFTIQPVRVPPGSSEEEYALSANINRQP